MSIPLVGMVEQVEQARALAILVPAALEQVILAPASKILTYVNPPSERLGFFYALYLESS